MQQNKKFLRVLCSLLAAALAAWCTVLLCRWVGYDLQERLGDTPSFLAAVSCVRPYFSISWWQPSATSMGFRSSRCRFSISARAAACSSDTSLMMTGTSSSPASRAARQRRSPAMMM